MAYIRGSLYFKDQDAKDALKAYIEEKFDYEKLTVFDDNIYIKSKTDFISIPISDYADYENTLYLAVKGARELSPLEKYLYAYDVTKKFKEYRKNELENKNIGDYDYFTQYEIKESSRNLYEVLDNNYIVFSFTITAVAAGDSPIHHTAGHFNGVLQHIAL